MASAIRGSRVGAGPMGEAERGEAIARSHVSYWCSNGYSLVDKSASLPYSLEVSCK